VARFRESRGWIGERVAAASGEHKRVLLSGLHRMLRIQTALSSTGLNAGSPEMLLRELEALNDAQVQLEVTTIVREIEWRLRELERESLLRGHFDTSVRTGMCLLDEKLTPSQVEPAPLLRPDRQTGFF
jgi:hypothetical protein